MLTRENNEKPLIFERKIHEISIQRETPTRPTCLVLPLMACTHCCFPQTPKTRITAMRIALRRNTDTPQAVYAYEVYHRREKRFETAQKFLLRTRGHERSR